MIIIKNKNDLEPYQKFYSLFSEAQKNNQKAIDAVSISSFNIETNEVESRYVNLKYIIKESAGIVTRLRRCTPIDRPIM